MQKIKHHILSTRPLPQKLVQQAAAAGVQLDVCSFIQTSSIVDEALAKQITQLFQKPITAVFTSMNAVAAVAQLFQKPMAWQVYSIGFATEKNIKASLKLHSIGTAPDAETLAHKMVADGVREAYFFCGNKRREGLPQILHAGGVALHQVVVYQTTETPVRIHKTYDGILFFSPSAAASFFSTNHSSPQTKLFAIGATTAAALQPFAAQQVYTSAESRKEILVQDAIAWFTQNPVQHANA